MKLAPGLLQGVFLKTRVRHCTVCSHSPQTLRLLLPKKRHFQQKRVWLRDSFGRGFPHKCSTHKWHCFLSRMFTDNYLLKNTNFNLQTLRSATFHTWNMMQSAHHHMKSLPGWLREMNAILAKMGQIHRCYYSTGITGVTSGIDFVQCA